MIYMNLYLVLVKKNDLRLFTTRPSKVKEDIMIESPEETEDYHGHFYHELVPSGKYREVWMASKYNEGIRVSSSIFSKEIQTRIQLDKIIEL